MLFLIFSFAGLTKAAAKHPLRAEVKQEHHPPSVKPALSSYPSNGQIHSQYHGYFVKADVKVPPPDEPLAVEDDFHPSSLGRLPPPAKDSRASPLKALPNSSPPPAVPPSAGGKAAEASRPKRAESSRPKSLAETKKASVEMVSETKEEETVSSIRSAAASPWRRASSLSVCLPVCLPPQGPNPILVALVMLLNVGLAIIFVHFLT